MGENPVTAAVNVTGASKFDELGTELRVVVEAHGWTVCESGSALLIALFTSPVYVAVIVCVPALKLDV